VRKGETPGYENRETRYNKGIMNTMKKNTKRIKYSNRISKMACGQSVDVPSYGKVTAYRCPRCNRRMFKLTGSSGNGWVPQGNLSLDRVLKEIKCVVF